MNHPTEDRRPEQDRQSVSTRPLYERPLYELVGDLLSIERQISDLDGELTPELIVALEGAESSIEAKAERILRVITNLRAEAQLPAAASSAFLAEGKRLSAAATRLTKRADELQEYLRQQMERLGLTRLTAGTWTIVRKRNSQPSVQWTRPAEEIPQNLRKMVSPELDRAAALELYHRDPEAIPPGIRIEHGTHIVIY